MSSPPTEVGAASQHPSDIGYLAYGDDLFPIRRVVLRDGMMYVHADFVVGDTYQFHQDPPMTLIGVDGSDVIRCPQIDLDTIVIDGSGVIEICQTVQFNVVEDPS